MKKSTSEVISILPCIVIAFYLFYTVYSIVHALTQHNGMDITNLGLINITHENVAKTMFTILISCVSLVWHSAYVFCAILGIGGMENKWVRMIFLMMAGAELATTYNVAALFIILAVFLFPEKTGVKHALHSALIFAVIFLIISVRAIGISPLDYIPSDVAYDGLILFEAIRYAIAAIIGIIGAVLALKLRNRDIAADKFHKRYLAGNIFTAVRFMLVIVTVVLMVRNTEHTVFPQIQHSILPECALILFATIVMVILALMLAYSMKNKHIFFVSCITLSLCLGSNFAAHIYFSASPAAFAEILYRQMYYMLLIAVIIGVFAKGQEFTKTIPAAVSMLMPVFCMTVRQMGITSKLFININSTLDDYAYYGGRIASGEKIYSVIIGYILICTGIAVATALVKNKATQDIDSNNITDYSTKSEYTQEDLT